MASEILLFNHIKKTAGSTLRHLVYRVYGGRHVYLVYAYPGFAVETYPEHLPILSEALAPARPRIRAIVSHAGYGLHERLPQHHRYRQFTMLREPVQRTISIYHFAIQNGSYPPETTLEQFLGDTERAYNVQTAYLGGLIRRENLDGRPLRREDYDAALLARAKDNLLAHDVFGLAERFDESLVLAAEVIGWPARRLVYSRQNVGRTRRSRSPLTPGQVELVREHNRLDLALYAFAVDHFERLLTEEVPDLPKRLRALDRVNRLHALAAPALRARLRERARSAARALGLIGAPPLHAPPPQP
jgi:hypothetical protein